MGKAWIRKQNGIKVYDHKICMYLCVSMLHKCIEKRMMVVATVLLMAITHVHDAHIKARIR